MRLFDMDSKEDYLLDGKYKVATPYAPLVDVVEVVRCKECKHWYNDGDDISWCNLTKWVCGGNGFCLYAERKDDEIDRR